MGNFQNKKPSQQKQLKKTCARGAMKKRGSKGSHYPSPVFDFKKIYIVQAIAHQEKTAQP